MKNCIKALVLGSGLLAELLSTTEKTSTTGSNKTDLLTSGSLARNTGGVTNVLMITTTMRMVNRIHSHTTNGWPAVALGTVLVESTTGLEDGLVKTTTSSNNTNGSTAVARNNLLDTGWELDTGDSIISIVSDNGSIISRGASKGTAITSSLFNVADDGTFGHSLKRKNVSNVQGSLLTAQNELSSVHTLGGNEGSSVPLVPIGITELNLGKGSTTTGIMDDLTDYSANVSVTLGKVEGTKLGGTLTVGNMGLEDSSVTLTLSTNDATHLDKKLDDLLGRIFVA